MPASAKVYGLFQKSLWNKEVNMNTDTIKVMLCTSAYTPDQDAHQYLSHVTNEASGTGYTAGGKALTFSGSTRVAYNAATNTMTFDADDTSWTGSTITARYAVIYDDTPSTTATKPLLAYVDFGGDVSTTAGTFQATWNNSGIIATAVA